MNDKCIIVTGSSSGIGRSITSKLLGLGAKVIGLARDHNKFKINNKNYVTYKIDLNDFHSLAAVTKNILKENMTFHCIPALWLKKYGIVISETFVVRKNGAERLTNYEQKLFDLEDFK